MIANARARFSGGALHLLELLDLAEEQEVVIRIEEGSASGVLSDSLLEMFERFQQAVPPAT